MALNTSLLLCRVLNELRYNLPALLMAAVGTCSKGLIQRGLQPTGLTVPWHGGLCSKHSLGGTHLPCCTAQLPACSWPCLQSSCTPGFEASTLCSSSPHLQLPAQLCRTHGRVRMYPMSPSAAFTRNGCTSSDRGGTT